MEPETRKKRSDFFRWKRMGISLSENSFPRRACAHAVQLAEHIDNENIKYVAGAILPLRTGTRMKPSSDTLSIWR
jgi:hypothetical protein